MAKPYSPSEGMFNPLRKRSKGDVVGTVALPSGKMPVRAGILTKGDLIYAFVSAAEYGWAGEAMILVGWEEIWSVSTLKRR